MHGPILVTGAGGFLGRAVVRAATAAGATVVAADLRETCDTGVGVSQATVDVTDATQVQDLLTEHQPRSVIHLAAYGGDGVGLLAAAEKNPRAALDVNVSGFANVLLAARIAGAAAFVWSSSITAYGDPADYDTQPVDESAALIPRTVYGATKAAADALSGSFADRDGTALRGIRLPHVYGPGRWYAGAQGEFVDFMRAVAAGEPASATGSDVAEDWAHVDDAADALIAATGPDRPTGVFNLVGHRASIAEMMQTAGQRAGVDVDVTVEPRTGPRWPAMDSSRIRWSFGHVPRHDLASGIDDYLAQLRYSQANAEPTHE